MHLPNKNEQIVDPDFAGNAVETIRMMSSLAPDTDVKGQGISFVGGPDV